MSGNSRARLSKTSLLSNVMPLPIIFLSVMPVFGHTENHNDVVINGFASLVAGKTLSRSVNAFGQENTFTADVPNDGLYHDDVSFGPDSNYGVQLSKKLTKKISLTSQFAGYGSDSFDARFSWAYMKYRLNGDSFFIAGKQRLPLFLYSDSLDVGYSYHWIRPPIEATGTIINEFNGILYEKLCVFDDWVTRSTFYYGATEEETKRLGYITAKDLYGAVFQISNPTLLVRLSYSSHNVAVEDNILSSNGVFHNSENPLDLTFWGIASRAEIQQGFVAFEYTHTDFGESMGMDQLVGTVESIGWYLTAGWEFKSVTPHITYHELKSNYPGEFGGAVQNVLELPSVPFSTDISSGSKGWTVGAKWELGTGVSFKMEYTDREEDSDNEYTSIFGKTREVSAFSMGFDLVF